MGKKIKDVIGHKWVNAVLNYVQATWWNVLGPFDSFILMSQIGGVQY